MTFGGFKIDEVLKHRVIIKKASDFGVIDSTKEYFLDGVIDMGTTSIEVPPGGIYISGYNFNLSGLTSSEDNYTLFTSPIGGSGDVLFMDFFISVNGANSKVYDLFSDNGFKAVEISRINFNNCTSRGELNNYRQGLETGTGYFGGTPELILSGVWIGGYYIDTSIVRGITDGAYSLFKGGVGFLMSSRFRSNQNIDLNSNVSFFDFNPANFVNPNTLQLDGCLISRNGVFDSNDTTIHPNIQQSDLPSLWRGNNGIKNTFVGGHLRVIGESSTIINTIDVFEDLNGTFESYDLAHFTGSIDGKLTHLGNSPVEFKVSFDMIIDCGQDREINLRLTVWDDSSSTFIDYTPTRRAINNFRGGRDVAFFNFSRNIILDTNDYVKLMVSNSTDTANVTAELDSTFTVEER